MFNWEFRIGNFSNWELLIGNLSNWEFIESGICRNILLDELNYINNTNYEELIIAIEYHYFSKRYINAKTEANNDNQGLKLIKKFFLIYKKFGAVIN